MVDSIETGRSKFDKEQLIGQYAILGSTSIIGYSNEYDYDGDFLLTARVGANAGSLYRYAGKVKISDNTVFIKGDNLNFLYYLLIKYDLNRLTFGSGQPLIKASELKSLQICFPSLPEQRAIASYFRRLDSLISTTASKVESLKQMKQASLQNMFPQNGEKIPKVRFNGFTGEWKEKKLGEIATMHARIGWQNLRTSEFLDSGKYLLITGTDFKDGKVTYDTCHYVEENRYEQDANIQVSNGSVLITKDGTLGKVVLVQDLPKPATLNAGVFNVVIKDKFIMDEQYLFQYVKAPFLMNYVNANATGGTIKHLNQNILVKFPIVVPSLLEQRKIASYFRHLDSQITLQSQRLEKLKQMKMACLDQMFV